MTNNSKIVIAAVAGIAVAITVVVIYVGFVPPSVPHENGASAQENETGESQTMTSSADRGVSRSFTYLSTQTVLVPAEDSADAEALCQDRDVVLSGGYTIGVYNSTVSSLSGDDAILYSDTAVRLINATTIHEGWHAGLTNTGTRDLTITANAICLDVTSE